MDGQKNGEIRYGTIKDLFSRYHSSEGERTQYKVLSIRRNPQINGHIVSPNNAQPFFSDIQDVSYHAIRNVWRVTLHNGNHIDVAKDT
jgi:hypothetical protein